MDIGIVSKAESQGLWLIGIFFHTHYLVAGGNKLKKKSGLDEGLDKWSESKRSH